MQENHTRHLALGTRHYHVHAALTTVAVLFSVNYIISKLSMQSFAPLVFAYLRVVGSALILNLLVRDPEPVSRADSWRLVGFSVLAVVLNQSLFLGGLALTSAHVAAILITMIPVFALGAAILLGYERATVMKVGGIALAAAGALLVVAREGFEGASKSLLGDLMIISNSLCYALYLVLSKPMMARLTARRVIARMFAVGTVLMLPISIWSIAHQDWRHIPARAWLGLALVIIGPTVAAYLLNAWALANAESSLVAAYSYLQPVVTTFLAAIFLGESIRPVAIAAAAMIFGGIYIAGKRVAGSG
jgi:drug/metabolite transporter (DMT)-like permease